MNKNKSIDGLTIRSAASNPASRSNKKKPAPKTKIKVIAKEPELAPEKPKTTPKKEVFPTSTPEPPTPS